MSSVATDDVSSVATEDISSVAKEDISSVATEDISSVATEDISCVAMEGIASVATEDIAAGEMSKKWMVRGLNGVAMDRHGLILWENETTQLRKDLDASRASGRPYFN